MGVSSTAVLCWVRKGRIPVFLTRKGGNGGKYWFSPTSVRNYKEDEERLRRLAIYEKARATMASGADARETLNAKSKPRVYKKVPAGWLTVRDAAERLDISIISVLGLRRRGHLEGQHFTGEWDAKRRPWFFHESTIEACRTNEEYQALRQRGKRTALALIGKYVPDTGEDVPEPPIERNARDTDLSFGYSDDEIRVDWNNSPFDIAKNYSYD